jgi:transcription elongation GreA/GreB family factor
MSTPKIDVSLKKAIIKSFKEHKEEVLDHFRQEERTRLDQVSNDDMDNRHIDSKNEETLHEMDFLTHSMEILEKEIYMLRSIPTEVSNDKVEFGSLIKTDKLVALVGAAHERMEVDGMAVVGVSMAAPLTRALEGKRVGEKVQLGSITHTLEEIC